MTNWAYKETPRPTTFLQWKGTEVCMDVYCVCGSQFHIDDYFAYAVQCLKCKRRYEMSTRIEMREMSPDEIWTGCEPRTDSGQHEEADDIDAEFSEATPLLLEDKNVN